VTLDEDILDTIQKQQGRLIAERNLRYELDNIETNNATQDQVKGQPEICFSAIFVQYLILNHFT